MYTQPRQYSSAGPRAAKQLLLLAVLILFLGVCAVFVINQGWFTLSDDLSSNEHVYSEVARVLSEGGLLYRDVWDHKPPVLYYYLAFFVRILGPTATTIHLAGMVIGLLFIVGTFFLISQFAPKWPALLVVGGLIAVYGVLFGAEEASPDFLMTALIAVSFGVASAARGRWYWHGAAGFILGIAFFSKQPAILHIPALVFFIAVTEKRRGRMVLATFGGFGLSIVLVTIWSVTSGVAADFWQAAFATNFRYVLTEDQTWVFQSGLTEHLQSFATHTLPRFSLFVPILLIAVFKRPENHRIFWGALVWLGCAIVGGLLGRAMTFAYFAQCLPPLILLSAIVLSELKWPSWYFFGATAVVVGLIFAEFGYWLFLPNFHEVQTQDERMDPLVAFVQDRVSEDECVWTWGEFEGDVNYFTQRRSCTRYINSMPMMVSENFFSEANRNNYMRDLMASEPALHARRMVWGYFPQLQQYADRYVRDEIAVFGDLHFYSVDRISWQPTDVNYGNFFRLFGFDVFQDNAACPGDTLQFAFTWDVERSTEQDYQIFLHLTSEDEIVTYAQYDDMPVPDRPTSTWTVVGDVMLSDMLSVQIPENLDAGTYHVVTGMYDLDTVSNLILTDNATQAQSSTFLLQEVQISTACNE